MKYILLTIFLLSMPFAQAQEVKTDTIKGVNIKSASRPSLQKSQYVTTNAVLMTSRELLKAACCNLAETFETNPSIDVNFADALTGTRQIRMLGLTSPYLMITEENIPSVRGASQAYGLSFTPGTWVESIQVTKGAGSVTNGFESISGQINTELIKPAMDIPAFANFYGSTDSRFEGNVHLNHKFNPHLSSTLFVHSNARIAKNDMNDDGFLDNPIGEQINILNRWQYFNAKTGIVSFVNLRYLNDRKQSGQVDFNPQTDMLTTNFWGSEINTERFDISTKIGYVWKDMPYQSIGFQNAGNRHDQESYFGLNIYNIAQTSYYSNLIFNSIINNTQNKFAAGVNFNYDKYDEYVKTPGINRKFDRIDNSLGAYLEYTYDNGGNFSFIAGLRGDYHNRLGIFATPRLHVRYNPWENGVLRFSVGRGKRTANVFAENQSLFATARNFNILDVNGATYGLNPEIAWNYGLSFSQKFKLFTRNGDIGFDLYRTDFSNQVIVDLYQSPQKVLFYDVNGKSFANSLQLDFNYHPMTHINLRTAYKFYDIQSDYIGGSSERPLQAMHRFFANIEVAGHNINDKQWKFDATYNWLGKQKLPFTATNPAKDRLPEFSNPFGIVNFQITRVFSKQFELYSGAENIFNYRQKRAILGNDNPFGNNFDASIVYAPIFGQMFYAGLRLKLI